jgi:tetratricopeptide (TPR) repeat protein
MSLFGRKAYSRSDSLAAASKAQTRGNNKKAITEYQKVLEHEPDNSMVQSKLAVLYAMTKQHPLARETFITAAKGFEGKGFDEKAIATYALAAMHLPRDTDILELLATKHLSRGSRAEAIKTLLDGRRRLRKKADRPLAIQLLRTAREIEEWHFDVTLELARLLASDGDIDAAKSLYRGLAERNVGTRLRRARGGLFRLSPTPAALYRWIRAALIGR